MGRRYIRQIKSQVAEVDPAQVSRSTWATGSSSVDVRDSSEVGRRPHPRSQARPARVPGDPGSRAPWAPTARRRSSFIAPPAGASRRRAHALGAARLREREVDDGRDHAVEGPRLQGRGPEGAVPRPARALLAPPARAGDRPRGARPNCSSPRCCCSAPAASARRPRSTCPPPAWARSAWWTTTTSTSPTSARQVIHTTDRIGTPKVDSAEISIKAINPEMSRS